MAFGEKSIRRKKKQVLRTTLSVTKATIEEALKHYLVPMKLVDWGDKLSLDVPETVTMKVLNNKK